VSAVALLAQLRDAGVEPYVAEGRLRLRGGGARPDEATLAAVREHTPELIELLQADLPDQRPVPPGEQTTILEQAEALLTRVGRERATKLVTALDAFQWARRRGMRGRERAALSALADAVVELGAEVAR
jgi:hypothetical protein